MQSQQLAKVSAVTLAFWIIKILATTLGETGGDALSMTLNLGYLLSTAIFGAVFLAMAAWQVRSEGFHALRYARGVVVLAYDPVFADLGYGLGRLDRG
jgi:uncharacterized membrane-anchored protein